MINLIDQEHNVNSDGLSIEQQRKIVRQLIVTKKDDIDVISDWLNKDIQNVLGINWVKLKLFNRYIFDWVSDEEFEKVKPTIFWELPVDDIIDHIEFENKYLNNKNLIVFESLPWQYDVRVASTRDCLVLQTWIEWAIRHSILISFEWDISDDDMERIKKWLINPVEKYIINYNDISLVRESPSSEEVEQIDWFLGMNDDQLEELRVKKLKLAMDYDDLKLIKIYFNAHLKRNPTVTEIKILDTYWSDHCRHTTYNTKIKTYNFSWNVWKNSPLYQDMTEALVLYENVIRPTIGSTDKPDSLMELATAGTKMMKRSPESTDRWFCDTWEEINACTFESDIEYELIDENLEKKIITERWEFQFKNETHNHPTEIEPFGWAGTCIWGCVRDPLSWRSWVFQAMRVSWSWDPTVSISETLAWKLAQRVISQISALWNSSYWNQLWVHTWQVAEYFHPWFIAKHLECGYVIAWAPKSHIRREKPVNWDIVIMLWWRTWRDGIWWASWSSKVHDLHSVATLWAEVQKWNPVEERKLTRLFLNPLFTRFIKRCNDFWAWWVSVAIWEIARWLDIDLDAIYTKYTWLDGTELAISESQERMAILISKNDFKEVMDLIKFYNVEAVKIADVTNDDNNPNKDKMVMRWKWNKIVDLPRDLLDSNGALDKKEMIPEIEVRPFDFFECIDDSVNKELKNNDLKSAFLANLRRIEVASQKWLWSIFDSSVWLSNVLAPYGWKYQVTPQNWMVSSVPSHVFWKWDSISTVISSHWYCPRLAEQSPYLWSIYAIIESVSKIVAMWWDRKKSWLSLQNYFGKLWVDPKRWWECYSAGLWSMLAQVLLWIPQLWWKDSMSGTFIDKDKRIDVPPTVVSFVTTIWHIGCTISTEFKWEEKKVIYFKMPTENFWIPSWDQYKDILDKIQELIKDGKVLSSSVVWLWWVGATISKMCFWNRIWFEFNRSWSWAQFIIDRLFNDDIWWIVLEVSDDLEKIPDNSILLWMTKKRKSILIGDVEIELKQAQSHWESTFNGLFPITRFDSTIEKIISSEKAKQRNELKKLSKGWLLWAKFSRLLWSSLKLAVPKVLVPVFPWTNSELDTMWAIKRAWMEPIEHIFRNLTPQDLINSTQKFAELLKDSQMLVFPWWFSAWDEPDWSAKYIASICRMNLVKDALNEFFMKSWTLTLWICNWFQALIKLWVFDETTIRENLNVNSPTLTYNHNHRHITDNVWLRICSVLSPFMSMVNIWDTFVIPVSHWEWRLFIRDKDTISRFIENWQVVMQYLDHDWNPTNEYNWSLQWIASLCSPDGRILWLMPHPERTNDRLFQNIPWNHNLSIFDSASKELG